MDFIIASIAPSLTNQELIDLIWKYNSGIWLPVGYTIPTGTNWLRFADTETLMAFDVSLITSADNYDAPLLCFSQGVVIKKDISVGGFLATNQGAIYVGSGLLRQVDLPKIVLMHSGTEILFGIDQQSSPPSNPTNRQLYIDTDDNHLYEWDGDSWNDLGHTDDYAGYFDTLQIKKMNGALGNIR